MKVVTLFFVFGFLSGCAAKGSRLISQGSDGPVYEAACNGQLNTIGDCYKEAAKVCLSQKVEKVDWSSDEESVLKSLIFKCK
jgi:hypothetical protein